MKKICLILALGLGGSQWVLAQQAKVPAEAAAPKKEVYQCPMKCEGKKTYDKKGKCPSCTMDLKPVKK